MNNYMGQKRRVRVGDIVEFVDLDTKQREVFKIVPVYTEYKRNRMDASNFGAFHRTVYHTDAKPEEGTISQFSPIGKSLLNKQVGETVSVKLFDRIRTVYIDKII